MGRYIVGAFATLHKDILIEADSASEAMEKAAQAFEDGSLRFCLDDIVQDLSDYDAMEVSDGTAPRRLTCIDGGKP